jgi:hypothetical protein
MKQTLILALGLSAYIAQSRTIHIEINDDDFESQIRRQHHERFEHPEHESSVSRR